MKKSLVIISFAFIFLLSMSIVSANFWDWLNGDATTTVKSGSSQLGRESGTSNECPSGWTQIFYPSNGEKKECCVPRPK